MLWRLLGGHRGAVRLAVQQRVGGLILHSLAFCPPSTVASANRLRSVFVRQARYGSGDETSDAAVVLEKTGLPSCDSTYYRQSIRFIWKCLKDGRAFGEWIEWAPAPARALRSSQGSDWRVKELDERREHLLRLGCSRIRRQWNEIPWRAANIDPWEATESLDSLDRSIPVLFASLKELPLPHPSLPVPPSS